MSFTSREATILQEAQAILSRRIADTPLLASFADLEAYLQVHYAHLDHETFHVLYLDRKNRLIEDHAHSTGSVSFVPVIYRDSPSMPVP